MEIPPAPISSCSKEHQRIYKEWFDIADSDGDGRITGNDATKFFAMSKLSRQELKQVWGLADSKRQGFLDFAGFVTAMQLVSLAQAGHELTSNILKNGVAAHMENIEPPSMEGLDAFATGLPSHKLYRQLIGLLRNPQRSSYRTGAYNR
ncbi:hypothetical protein JRO89_XS06G0157700 [Xanthoceras sorbifolium]|uniref:Uncharacterized protein n=1 Tax=Xanthoceras sorbifolium TaxID=99658 RepID=A0ABQ8HYL3_9ROSI|nr:hypothetical protein JRO89_XS06G0157700 [Xanthoceras sorbifolium]